MSQFNNKEEQTRVNTFRGDFRNARGENNGYRNNSTQRYNRNPRRFNDNRRGNGQHNFQRRPGYHNNRRENNQRFNNSYRRGGYNKRSPNNRKRVVQDKDGWSTIKSSNNRFNHNSTNKTTFQKKDDNQFNLLKETTIKKPIEGIPKVIKSKPVLQGAWGKGISNAVKEDVKFEKAPEKQEEDNGMLTLSNDLNEITNDAKKSATYLFKPLGKSVNWGDMEYDEDDQYYSEDEDDYYNDNKSVCSDGSSEYENQWDERDYY